MEYQLYPLSDHAIVIELGKEISEAIQQKIQLITSFLDDYSAEWMIAYIPAFTTVTIFYDPMKLSSFNNSDELPYDQVCHYIDQFMPGMVIDKQIESRVVDIPVCYGGELGPDIAHESCNNRSNSCNNRSKSCNKTRNSCNMMLNSCDNPTKSCETMPSRATSDQLVRCFPPPSHSKINIRRIIATLSASYSTYEMIKRNFNQWVFFIPY